MTSFSAVPAIVESQGEYATVRFADGSSLQLPREVLSRSSLLRQALLDSNINADERVAVPDAILQSWLQWLGLFLGTARTSPATDQPSEGCSTALTATPEQNVRYLQAADFLDDQEAFHTLCKITAQSLIPQAQSNPHPGDICRVIPEHVQILLDLHTNLLSHVFAASECSCIELLSKLPPQLHRAALLAKYPSVVAHKAISVSTQDTRLCRDHWSTFWNLLTEAPHLESLAIIEEFRPCEFRRVPLVGLSTLTKLSITGIFPSFLPELPHVQSSWLTGRLPCLRHLELASAGLASVGFSKLVPLIETLTGLQHLSLRNNRIGLHLVPCLPHLKCLQHLDLSNCKLESAGVIDLLPVVAELQQLSLLDMSENNMHDDRTRLIEQLQLLSKLENLQHFSMLDGYNDFFVVPKLRDLKCLQCLEIPCGFPTNNTVVHTFAQELQTLTQLTHLKLESLYLEAPDAKVLAPALERLSKLQALSVSFFMNSEVRAKDMLTLVAPLTALQSLSLDEFKMSGNSVVAFVSHLKTLSPFLQHLSLSRISHGNPSDMEVLAEGLGSLTGLTCLNLCSLQMYSKAAEELASSLVDLKSLQQLYIVHNNLFNDGTWCLAVSIRFLTALQELSFEGNVNNGMDGSTCSMQALAPHLSKLSSLSMLNLGGNSTVRGGGGGEQLEEHLSHLSSLRQLHLQKCTLEESDVHFLIRLLEHSTGLTTLNLCMAHIRFDLGDLLQNISDDVSSRVAYTPRLQVPVCMPRINGKSGFE